MPEAARVNTLCETAKLFGRSDPTSLRELQLPPTSQSTTTLVVNGVGRPANAPPLSARPPNHKSKDLASTRTDAYPTCPVKSCANLNLNFDSPGAPLSRSRQPVLLPLCDTLVGHVYDLNAAILRRERIAHVLEHGFAVTRSNQIRSGYPIFLDKIAFDAFSAPLGQLLVVGARTFGIGMTGNNKSVPRQL